MQQVGNNHQRQASEGQEQQGPQQSPVHLALTAGRLEQGGSGEYHS